MAATNGNGDLAGKTMKAQQFDARDGKLHLNEVPIPVPEPHELLVKMACASLCHSDCMPFEGNTADLQSTGKPVTIGHEGSGVVVQVGSATKGFKVGDEVGFLPAKDSCFECDACKNVHNLWCEKGQAKMQGFADDGYFQEYVAVDYRNSMVLPSNLPASEAAPLFCAGVTAFNAINGLKLQPGKWVAVIGCGGLGHLGIQYAKAMGYRVIGIDITDNALEAAKASGAEHTFHSINDKDYVSKIIEITNGGVDAAVNFTASLRAYNGMPGIIRPMGLLMAVGIPKEPFPINLFDVSLGKLRIQGANNGQCYTMVPAIEFTAKHNIKAHLEYYKLEELDDMIKRMMDHKAKGRMAVKF